MTKTFKIQIKGRVQGVGFRPFIFNLAREFQLQGSVSNNENGVIIFCNSTEKDIAIFSEHIQNKKPEIAVITAFNVEETTYTTFKNFNIVSSEKKAQVNLPLTPDFAICNSCKADITYPKNRRYNYPFTTCVNCGPRYAITTKFPFERAHTALASFEMCPHCHEEYINPNNRRFHSQTNSCNTCGISLRLSTNTNKTLSEHEVESIEKAAQHLLQGKILAIKNTNGYLLCCNALNLKTIETLRAKKQRLNKPFALLYPSIVAVKNDFQLSSDEEKTLQSIVAPIVILQNTKATHLALEAIAPNLNQTGVMLPSSALLYLLMQKLNQPIVATSGNFHGGSIIADEENAYKQLKTVADYFLHHNLDIQFPQDDSVVKFSKEKQIILRRSRGLAPNYLNANVQTKGPILAMGADLKSTFTLVPNSETYVSPYFGNLENYEVLTRYKTTIESYLHIFETQPKIILIDKHKQYQSAVLGNQYALKYNAGLHEIQHHKAHFSSVLGEHNLFDSKEKILGVIWDGTGLGDDNKIWGGEFFIYQNYTIQRTSHFEYFDWLANDKMAKEPRLALFSVLDEDTRPLIRDKFSKTEWAIYSKIITSNTLKTSSVGRLFDAVASALDLVDINTFESEAAMLLETCARTSITQDCEDLLEFRHYVEVPCRLLLKIIIKAYNDGVSKAYIARSFIYTLVKSIIRIAKEHQIKTIACSGGVFQNTLLVSMLGELAEKENIDLKLNCKLSPNDENISFGQLMYHQYINE